MNVRLLRPPRATSTTRSFAHRKMAAERRPSPAGSSHWVLYYDAVESPATNNCGTGAAGAAAHAAGQQGHAGKRREQADAENGVDDGTRTHDSRDHNPGLYQLSYAHH